MTFFIGLQNICIRW